MKIETVKELESGYLVNESISIPKDPLNRDYAEVEKWIADGGKLEKEDLLQKTIQNKQNEIRSLRINILSENILVKTIDGKSYYVATDPEINIFQSAILMPNDATRLWGCYVDGKKELIELTKLEILSIAHHYEERKNLQYNLCDLRRSDVESITISGSYKDIKGNKITALEAVQNFDINKIYE
tara:strand:+ start:25940 stop:26491 length:552 start_codon:yes stop_codon:yes gene_type:complete